MTLNDTTTRPRARQADGAVPVGERLSLGVAAPASAAARATHLRITEGSA